MSLPDLGALVREASIEALPDMIGRLEAAKAVALLRLSQSMLVPTARPADATQGDRNLDAKEAARRLGMSPDWLYRNALRLPFTVRIGRRVLFSSRRLEAWVRGRAQR